jgi:DNA-binding Xre family transcriptional regulator
MIKLQIREAAEKRGITTAYQLQKAAGFHPGHAARLWEGELKMIGLDTINALCRALKCQPGTLFKYEMDADE